MPFLPLLEESRLLTPHERVNHIFTKLSEPDQTLVSILTDPVIIALDRSPAADTLLNYLEALPPMAQPDFLRLLGESEGATQLLESIDRFLPRAISLANLTFSRLLTGETVRIAEIDKLASAKKVVIFHPYPSPAERARNHGLAREFTARPIFTDPTSDQRGQPVLQVPHSPYETLRDTLLARMLRHHAPTAESDPGILVSDLQAVINQRLELSGSPGA